MAVLSVQIWLNLNFADRDPSLENVKFNSIKFKNQI